MADPVVAQGLPRLYERWMEQWPGSPSPRREDRATCHECAMCSSDVVRQPNGTTSYSPSTKCCTVHPTVPNFLIGLLLADDSPALARGRESMLARCHKSNASTPLGVRASPEYELLHRNVYRQTTGVSERMRCPHYLVEDGGTCGIWQYRPSLCATWFCKYNRGATGLKFWLGFRYLLEEVETALAIWAAGQVGIPGAQLLESFPHRDAWNAREVLGSEAGQSIRDGFLPDRARALWGEWFNREIEYFKLTGKLVSELTWREVIAIAGPEAQARESAVLEDLRVLNDQFEPIPDRLQVAGFVTHPSSPGTVRITTYSYNDPLELGQSLFAALSYFDGRPLSEVRSQLASDLGVGLSDDLIRRLLDYKVLRDSTAQPETRPLY